MELGSDHKAQEVRTTRGARPPARWRIPALVPALLTALFPALLLTLAAGAQAQAPANPYSYSKVASYTYDALGRVQTETVEPDNLPSCVVSSYTYDTWGNRNTTTVANCAGAVPARQQFASRTSSVDYSATAGLFPGVATNALNQTASAVFDARFGVKTSATDVAGLTANWQLDDFGRVVKETRPDSTSTVTQYCYIAGRVSNTSSNSVGCETAVPADAPADAVMYVHAEVRDTANVKMGPYSRTYADRLGRTIRTVTEGFDGTGQPTALKGAKIVQDVVYSAVGTKVLETQPYYLATGSSKTTGANDVGATLTQYDALGRITAVYTSDPNGSVASQVFGSASTTVSYGAYGAKKSAKTTYAYAALTTTITNDKAQARLEEKNPIGLLVRITDPAGGQLAHQHDAFGNLVATKDALQNSITIQYDIRGNRLQLNDPDAGLIKYDYDALGQVVWQENANQRAASQSTTMAYDKLGRMTSRVEPEGTGTWSYDKYADNSACNKGAGRLCESKYVRAGTTDTRANKTYYDNLGRATSDLTTVTTGGVASGPSMATARSYSATTGRLDTKTYPTGVKVQYAYTTLGFSGQLNLATAATLNPLPATAGGTPGAATTLAAGTTLWQALVVNAWGRTEQQQWSNGVNGSVTYEPGSGRITGLTAGAGTGTNVLNRNYTWDSLNNLTYRADNIGDAVAGAVTETFEYVDGLSRLTKYTVSAPAIPGGSRAVSLTYNALGMLLNKSDVGAYTYPANGAGSVRPHALQSVAAINAGGTTNYQYDANGNLQSASAGKYRTVAYTSFNLPDSQSGIGGAPAGSSGGTANYTWVYDENHQRIKEVRTIAGGTLGGTRTTWFLHPDNAGNLGFEYEVDTPTTPTAANPTATNARHYLSFGGQTLGVLVSSAALPTIPAGQTTPPTITTIALNKVEYWHKDHLGSLSATTDHTGAVTARYAYDPFGKRRYTNGSYDAFGAIVIDFSPATNAGTDRGFTEHEHLDDIGLIHMNGRIFDPTLGRFMQADRFIQAPTDLQNYNRYAYCLNNPLTCTDPTGFESELPSTSFAVFARFEAQYGDRAYNMAMTAAYCQCTIWGINSNEAQDWLNRYQGRGMSVEPGTAFDGRFATEDSIRDINQTYGSVAGFLAAGDQNKVNQTAIDIAFTEAFVAANDLPRGDAVDLAGPMSAARAILLESGGNGSGSAATTGAIAAALANSEIKSEERIYVTYTKVGPNGEIYAGRTSGFGTPEEVVAARDRGHIILNYIEGYSAARVDAWAYQSNNGSSAIRGREQQIIDWHGGTGSPNVRNAINGISPFNPFYFVYMVDATETFGGYRGKPWHKP